MGMTKGLALSVLVTVRENNRGVLVFRVDPWIGIQTPDRKHVPYFALGGWRGETEKKNASVAQRSAGQHRRGARSTLANAGMAERYLFFPLVADGAEIDRFRREMPISSGQVRVSRSMVGLCQVLEHRVHHTQSDGW